MMIPSVNPIQNCVGQIKLVMLVEVIEGIIKIGHVFNSYSCFDSVFIQHKLYVFSASQAFAVQACFLSFPLMTGE